MKVRKIAERLEKENADQACPAERLSIEDIAFKFLQSRPLMKCDILYGETRALDAEGKDLRGTMWGDYRSEVLRRGTTKRPRKGQRSYFYRDFTIGEAVELVMKYGFGATRNDASRQKGVRESACSIVARALKRCEVKLDEDSINKIWGAHIFNPKNIP